MLFITKRNLNRLAQPYRESDMLLAYATPQHIFARSSRAILLVNEDKLIVLFLNLFSTRVLQQVELKIADLQEPELKFGVGLASVLSFHAVGGKWRFQIMRTILTLGSMQGEFLDFVQSHIVDRHSTN